MTEQKVPDHHQDNDAKKSKEQQERSNLLEKIFTILSLIVIFSLIGYLIVKSRGTPTPATFELKQAAPIIRGDFTAVEVFVTNVGEEAAKAVNIHGEIAGSSNKPIEAEATLDWLPGSSRRRITLIFPGDVTTSTPEVKVTGYEEP